MRALICFGLRKAQFPHNTPVTGALTHYCTGKLLYLYPFEHFKHGAFALKSWQPQFVPQFCTELAMGLTGIVVAVDGWVNGVSGEQADAPTEKIFHCDYSRLAGADIETAYSSQVDFRAASRPRW